MVQAAALADEPGLTDPVLEKVRAFYEENHEGHRDGAPRAPVFLRLPDPRAAGARIPPGQRVLDVGCGSGPPARRARAVAAAWASTSPPARWRTRGAPTPGRDLHFFEGDGADPRLLAQVGGPFDAVVLVNVVTHLTDVQRTLEALRAVCHPRTRVFIYSYSRLWQPVLRLAELLRLKHRPPPDAWLPPEEVRAMLRLADFEVVRHDYQIVFPAYVPLLSDLLNRYVGRLPGVEWLSLMYGLVARPSPAPLPGRARLAAEHQRDHPLPQRGRARPRRSWRGCPTSGPNAEFLFVEGNSTDDTLAVLRQVLAENPTRPFRLLKQEGRGKGDAVRLGFARARGEVVLILDSDMGVAPEDVPKFVDALVRGKGEMVNGSRMVYPMEGEAMRFLNLLANKAFALLFSWVLGQQVRDTLCGTKALYREDYERIAANRAFFGDFDPFGDFDLLFGAARLNLEIVDVAVRYHERRYGADQHLAFPPRLAAAAHEPVRGPEAEVCLRRGRARQATRRPRGWRARSSSTARSPTARSWSGTGTPPPGAAARRAARACTCEHARAAAGRAGAGGRLRHRALPGPGGAERGHRARARPLHAPAGPGARAAGAAAPTWRCSAATRSRCPTPTARSTPSTAARCCTTSTSSARCAEVVPRAAARRPHGVHGAEHPQPAGGRDVQGGRHQALLRRVAGRDGVLALPRARAPCARPASREAARRPSTSCTRRRPRRCCGAVARAGELAERVPVLREIAGSLLIRAVKP